MKVSKISIKDFHQFKDFTIDLTYPKGHAKEGQPLDKVCFIGQSGTGKTTLLEMIPYYLYNYKTRLINNIEKKRVLKDVSILVGYGFENQNTLIFHLEKDGEDGTQIVLSFPDDVDGAFDLDNISTLDFWRENSSKLVYLPAALNYYFDTAITEDLMDLPVVDFSTQNVRSVWNIILDKIQSYQEQELQIRQEISKTVEQASNDLETIKKALKKLEDWKSTEFNPIQDIAESCLDPLLKPFKLKVKTELDIKGKDDIGFIKIEDFNGNEIPNGLWSTGTKQVILSALPLYLLKPKNTIILFDEPERSLYPDLQRTLVDYYATLADNCQFFYATHSPIIASSFDPWEIVELKFDGDGHVQRELYYEGENHIDNYKWNPKYLRWDDILLRIFDMENDGSDERRKKLDELAKQNVKYRKLEQRGNTDSDDAKKVLDAIQHLSKELSHWD